MKDVDQVFRLMKNMKHLNMHYFIMATFQPRKSANSSTCTVNQESCMALHCSGYGEQWFHGYYAASNMHDFGSQVYLKKLIFYIKSVFPHASHLDHIILNDFIISLMFLLKYTLNKKISGFLKQIHFISFKYRHMQELLYFISPTWNLQSKKKDLWL